MTLEAFTGLKAAQGGQCAINGCSSEAAHVDHDHVTGNVRGILCFRCNIGIGHLGDDLAGVQAAAEYLSRQAGQSNPAA